MNIGFHYQGIYITAKIKNGVIKVFVEDIEIQPDFEMRKVIKKKINELNN